MLNEFILLTIAHVIAVASPGADFAVVLKNTLNAGRRAGTITAIGVGLGIAIHLIYTLLGIAFLLANSPNAFFVIKMFGALYLLWLAWQAFQSRPRNSANEVIVSRNTLSERQAFTQGFLTNVFNPKVTVFFLVLFTSIVSQTTPMSMQVIYGVWLVVYTMIWFILVAWVFSRKTVLNWYRSHGHWIDWGMGSFLTFIALKLLITSV